MKVNLLTTLPILFFSDLINVLVNLLIIYFIGNPVTFSLLSRLSSAAFAFREISYKFTTINLINCILCLWVRMPEFLCQFHCTHWNLKSIFQILAFRPFFLNTLLFTYYVPKPPCQCNWKQARKRLDGSDEWKRDTDPSTHNPLAGIQARLMGTKSNYHLMAGQWSVWNELVISSLVPHGQVFILQFPPSVTAAQGLNESETKTHFSLIWDWMPICDTRKLLAPAFDFSTDKQNAQMWMSHQVYFLFYECKGYL